jgi:hypothetical protein
VRISGNSLAGVHRGLFPRVPAFLGDPVPFRTLVCYIIFLLVHPQWMHFLIQGLITGPMLAIWPAST